MERRALAGLEFLEGRHRKAWREAARVERGEVVTGPADGAVVLDVGGTGVATEEVRPFLLRELRVNPAGRFALGTLDEAGEREAMEAVRGSDLGVVFLVEGWSLSPKQMGSWHGRVREALGEGRLIRYVVAGSEEEAGRWREFVDGLRDGEAEVFRFGGQG